MPSPKKVKNNYKRKKNISHSSIDYKNIFSIIAIAVLSILIFAAISFVCLYSYRLFTATKYFDVKYVKFDGLHHLKKEEALKYSGIAIDKNIFYLNIKRVEVSLLRNVWVKNVSVKRLLPDQIYIKIEEYSPRFWVQKEGVLYYADEEGQTIAPVAPDKFVSLPFLRVDAGATAPEQGLPVLVNALDASTLPLRADEASQIRLRRGNTVEIEVEGSAMRVVFGLENPHSDLKHLGFVFADLSKRGELNVVREIRATGNNVWVKRSADIQTP